jgi:hypothetical protein
MKIVAAENIAVGKYGSYKILIKYRRENIDHIYIDNPLTNKGCLKRNLFTLLSIWRYRLPNLDKPLKMLL